MRMLLLASLFAIVVLHVAAGQRIEGPYVVGALAGKYEPLDFWTTMKLGSAYYTNPSAVRDAHIIYLFDSKLFQEPSKYEQLWDLANTGSVAFGIPDKTSKNITVFSTAKLAKDHKIESSADWANLMLSAGFVVVSNKDSLLGAPAAETLTLVKPTPSVLDIFQTPPPKSAPSYSQ
jgi:hypothetical protein